MGSSFLLIIHLSWVLSLFKSHTYYRKGPVRPTFAVSRQKTLGFGQSIWLVPYQQHIHFIIVTLLVFMWSVSIIYSEWFFFFSFRTWLEMLNRFGSRTILCRTPIETHLLNEFSPLTITYWNVPIGYFFNPFDVCCNDFVAFSFLNQNVRWYQVKCLTEI